MTVCNLLEHKFYHCNLIHSSCIYLAVIVYSLPGFITDHTREVYMKYMHLVLSNLIGQKLQEIYTPPWVGLVIRYMSLALRCALRARLSLADGRHTGPLFSTCFQDVCTLCFTERWQSNAIARLWHLLGRRQRCRLCTEVWIQTHRHCKSL